MRPKASYLVCYTRRSGSNLLCDALMSTGVAGQPDEYFRQRSKETASMPFDAWERIWRDRPFAEALSEILDLGTDASGLFAAKIEWINVHALLEGLNSEPVGQSLPPARQLETIFPAVRYVWVTRRDKVRQAISLFRARQTDLWLQRQDRSEPSRNPTFNSHLINAQLQWIVHEEALWARFFSDANITPYTVVYEDFLRDYEGTARRVLQYLGVPLPAVFQFPPPRLQKQADELTESWVERYYAAERTKHRLATVANLPSVLARPSLRHGYLIPRVDSALARGRRLLRTAREERGVRWLLARRS